MRGVSLEMRSFDFLFGMMLSEMILCPTNHLSRTLPKRHALYKGQQIARLVVPILLTLRSDDFFELFWQKLTFVFTTFRY